MRRAFTVAIQDEPEVVDGLQIERVAHHHAHAVLVAAERQDAALLRHRFGEVGAAHVYDAEAPEACKRGRYARDVALVVDPGDASLLPEDVLERSDDLLLRAEKAEPDDVNGFAP